MAEEPQAAAPKELRRREAMSLDWGARMGMRWANARREAIQVFADGSGALDSADEKTTREAPIKLRLA